MSASIGLSFSSSISTQTYILSLMVSIVVFMYLFKLVLTITQSLISALTHPFNHGYLITEFSPPLYQNFSKSNRISGQGFWNVNLVDLQCANYTLIPIYTPFSADLDQTTSRIPHSILLRGRREAFDLGASHQSHEIRRISREKVQFWEEVRSWRMRSPYSLVKGTLLYCWW